MMDKLILLLANRRISKQVTSWEKIKTKLENAIESLTGINTRRQEKMEKIQKEITATETNINRTRNYIKNTEKAYEDEVTVGS